MKKDYDSTVDANSIPALVAALKSDEPDEALKTLSQKEHAHKAGAVFRELTSEDLAKNSDLVTLGLRQKESAAVIVKKITPEILQNNAATIWGAVKGDDRALKHALNTKLSGQEFASNQTAQRMIESLGNENKAEPFVRPATPVLSA